LKQPPGLWWRRTLSRYALWFALLVVLSSAVATLLHAEVSEADKKKRDAFLKAREEMRTVPSATPSESPASHGKPKAAKKKSKKKATPPDDEDEAAATPAKKHKAGASHTPSRKKSSDEDEEPTPRPTAATRESRAFEEPPLPRATPVPSTTPVSTPPGTGNLPADITIEKSGIEQEQGLEPPPPPPPRRSFFWPFSRRPSYRYLNSYVIDAIRRAPVQRERWKFIIVHNSGTRQGNARAFDYYHRHVRRMPNGLAYHFVVGNGTSSGNGQIEIGDRWRRQINGGHVHSDYLNNISLGICLVGDFNHTRPTRAQLDATEELIKYLRDRCGKVDGRSIPVRPHREMNPPRWATDCPGDAFPYTWFQRF
jgi:N-acetylmuramoyl-L-alanine amidase-like protein